jgi:hypothetical protein
LEDFVRETANLPQADEDEDMGAGTDLMDPAAMAAMLAAQQAPPPGKPGGPAVDPAKAAEAEGEAGALDPSAV